MQLKWKLIIHIFYALLRYHLEGKNSPFFDAKRGIQVGTISKLWEQYLGTLMLRPQNPLAVRGEQFLS